VALSLSLSPLWLWFYFSDQFDIDLFSHSIGYVLSAATMGMGLAVMRYAPGGEGPMNLYVVVSLSVSRVVGQSPFRIALLQAT
jgi:hypothetical protein